MSKIGFIGAGNMGSALLGAAVKKCDPEKIYVADNSIEKAENVSKTFGCVVSENTEIAKTAKFIFLGVKPQVMQSMLEDIKKELTERNDRFILVTMAAGLSCKDILSFIGKKLPIIRIMPNTPVSVSSGMILYCKNELVSDSEETEFLNFMSQSGSFVRLDENLFDAGCALSGCGPAFVYMFINALINGGIDCGLTEKDAKILACNTLIGASKMVLLNSKAPNDLKIDVCSPGGCTIEGVKALEENKFEDTVIQAVKSAYKKSKLLGK